MIKRSITFFAVAAIIAALLPGIAMAEEEDWIITATLEAVPEMAVSVLPGDAAHSVTGIFLLYGAPREGMPMTFEIISGPNAGLSDTIPCDDTGQATFSYTYTQDPPVPGEDVIRVSTPPGLYVDIIKRWELAGPPVVPNISGWGLLAAAIMFGLLIPIAARSYLHARA